MPINNKGKFSLGHHNTPVPSKEFDEEARRLHDEELKKQLEKAPSIGLAAASGKVGYVDVNGNFIEDSYEIKIKDKYIEVSFECVNQRHRDLVSKITGSIMEFLSGYIQDYSSSVTIDIEMIPKVLDFYDTKYNEIIKEIDGDKEKENKCKFLMNFPSILFKPDTVKTFLSNTQAFINNDKSKSNYLNYLLELKECITIAGKHNRFIKDGDERKKI